MDEHNFVWLPSSNAMAREHFASRDAETPSPLGTLSGLLHAVIHRRELNAREAKTVLDLSYDLAKRTTAHHKQHAMASDILIVVSNFESSSHHC